MASSAHGALVLFSGGQDSSVCLAWALARYTRVETVGFDYGQRHSVELKAREAVRAEIIKAFREARAKDFAASDAIRDQLSAAGIVVEDGASGSTWTIGRS